MNHYETLGVPPDASADTIKQAYRRLGGGSDASQWKHLAGPDDGLLLGAPGPAPPMRPGMREGAVVMAKKDIPMKNAPSKRGKPTKPAKGNKPAKC